MADGSKVSGARIGVGAVCALGAFLTLAWAFYYVILGTGGVDRWQTLGLLAVAVAIASAVAGMLRFALAPLIGPDPSPSGGDADAAIRSRVAPIVLAVGSIAIVALALALIITYAVLAASYGLLHDKIDTLLGGVFSTVLPVVATWVGTVLAFYFGSENFRQAAQSTRETLGQQAPKKTITDVMIPYERIGRLEAESEEAAAATLMTSVINTMSAAATRVIVFNKRTKAPIYIIRSSTPPMPENWIASDYGKGSALPDGATIQAYLDQNGGKNKADAQKFRFIDQNATLEVALALMTKEGVDDLFITKDGQSTSPVLGWVATQDLLGQ
jgi:hypothetical protein